MEVPRLGVQLELQLPTYATATEIPDLRHVCYLHHSSEQRQILNPLNEARDRNWHPHSYKLDSFPLSQEGNAENFTSF